MDTPADAGYWYAAHEIDEKARAREVLETMRLYRAADMAMRRRTRDSMAMGENELLALRFLLQQPDHTARPSEITKYLALSSASITALLDRLEKTGRITRMSHPSDRRSILVKVTEHADQEVRETLGVMHARMYAVAASLSAEEQATVVGFLRRMVDAVDGVAPQPAD
ncbi:MarR family winged helix-turn-helix transcriptional regulator [Microbacterium sp.]|uniref:MarR family winged helix-turn-helix transcriptional regulator n=1 Tax=Microbacterium sp. TaxID=51671 RepID=UPI0028126560|nr:MarR family transcriptional regulator [Microbacterium sp.]